MALTTGSIPWRINGKTPVICNNHIITLAIINNGSTSLRYQTIRVYVLLNTFDNLGMRSGGNSMKKLGFCPGMILDAMKPTSMKLRTMTISQTNNELPDYF